jgi:hypothetical protein
VLAISPTTPQQGDRPWWTTTTLLLVLVPGVLVAFLMLWLSAIRRLVGQHQRTLFMPLLGFFPRRPARRYPWAEEGFKVILEWQLRGLRDREHTMLRVRSSTGVTVCRMASPVRAAPLSVGDRLELRGRRHRDGTLRVFKLYNRTTQCSYSPSFLAPQVVGLSLISVVFIVLFGSLIAS